MEDEDRDPTLGPPQLLEDGEKDGKIPSRRNDEENGICDDTGPGLPAHLQILRWNVVGVTRCCGGVE